MASCEKLDTSEFDIPCSVFDIPSDRMSNVEQGMMNGEV